ncbi:MAG: hypothetical protein L3K09_05880 [Thermoplasmata archaeon]|nr:hypothetical protein [Thermoplasmata archaeon]
MSEQHYFNLVAGLIALSVVVGGAVAFAAESHSTGSAPAPSAAAPDHLYMTIAFNPGTGLDEYFPGNMTVPAGVPVIFTITSYDNGTNVVPASNSQVSGTVGGSASMMTAGSSAMKTYTSLPMDGIAHTFTMVDKAYSLNVPIQSAASMSAPVTVIFTAYFNTTGTFTWMCMAPCDPTAMTQNGFMTGTVTVE